jgi:glycosyltransferase involved in cell wall biosynthesis
VTPRASIGMPVFNGATTVGRAIESILAQTMGDFELLVSDNASTDMTEAVCRGYSARDPRIRYTRQPRPMSALDNFGVVLDGARAPYFMWLAADDYVLPRLLEQAVSVLDAWPDVVCAAPRTEFLESDGSRRPAAGTFPLLGDVRQNLCRYLADPADNSRFYGVYRRDVMRRVLPTYPYYALDWAVAAGTLMYGRHFELPEVLLIREANDALKYTRTIDTIAGGPVTRLLPLARFTRALLGPLGVRPYPSVLWALVRLNVAHHVMYCQYRYPRYGRIAYRVGATLERLGLGAWRVLGRRLVA